MVLIENIDIDLVFICGKSLQKQKDFKKKDNQLIFQSQFWEKIFYKCGKNMINIQRILFE